LSYTKIQWGTVFSFFLLDFIWIYFSSLFFIYDKELSLYVVIGLFVFFFPYLFYKLFRPDPRIVSLLESLVFILIFVQLMIVFSFLVATLNYPLVDSSLALTDSYFRINTAEIVSWFRAHKKWLNFVTYFYNSFLYQFPFVIFYFSSRGDVVTLQRFIMQFMMALSLTIILSGVLPALGAYVWYGYTPSIELGNALDQLVELREGILNISKRNGIVTFPSFHAIMALIFIYTFRSQRLYIFIPILILNVLLIGSCLPIGEHYFADLLGAIPVFLLTIWIDSIIYSSLVQKPIMFKSKTAS